MQQNSWWLLTCAYPGWPCPPTTGAAEW
jgi:hypothetical protein